MSVGWRERADPQEPAVPVPACTCVFLFGILLSWLYICIEGKEATMMTFPQALFVVISGFMAVSGKHDQEAEDRLVELVKETFHKGNLDFDPHEEIEYLAGLSGEEFLTRFAEAVDLLAGIDTGMRKKALDFAFEMILADNKITAEEAELFLLVGEHWQMDTKNYCSYNECIDDFS